MAANQGDSFTTTLSALCSATDAHMLINGLELNTLERYSAMVWRASCDNDEWYFDEQRVTVTDGGLKLMTAQGIWGHEPIEALITLRPIAPNDLAARIVAPVVLATQRGNDHQPAEGFDANEMR